MQPRPRSLAPPASPAPVNEQDEGLALAFRYLPKGASTGKSAPEQAAAPGPGDSSSSLLSAPGSPVPGASEPPRVVGTSQLPLPLHQVRHRGLQYSNVTLAVQLELACLPVFAGSMVTAFHELHFELLEVGCGHRNIDGARAEGKHLFCRRMQRGGWPSSWLP